MSKRQSTIFNYFQSPKVLKKENGSSSKLSITESSKDNNIEHDSDVEDTVKATKRSRSQIIDSSDSECETPEKTSTKKLKSYNNSESESENATPNKPKNKVKKRIIESDDEGNKSVVNIKDFSFKKSSFTDTIIDENSSSAAATEPPETEVSIDINESWLHNRLEFLKPHKIMDIDKRRPGHPFYDKTTIYVPESFLKDLTPAMKQWWELKSRHMDCVLFFKVGKFYELYHMDAVVGVTELGFSYMKGEFAHSGFPESAYAKMASMLIERGYKVARVEQTETPDMMAARCKAMSKVTKHDKVVKREICQISTNATFVCTAQMPEPLNNSSNYMYGLSMKEVTGGSFKVGVCFIETSIGIIHLSEFNDDKHFSRLLALFAEYSPTLILTERGGLNRELSDLLNNHFKDVRKDSLISKSQFLTASDTLEKLSMACYFRNKEGNFHWPEIFKNIADDCLPKPEYELVIKALGACLWYLKDSQIDIQVFTVGKFEWYDPLDCLTNRKSEKEYLILDAATVTHLNLLGSKGSLQSVLDHCQTAFGKRLLQRWICRPLCNVKKIKERQNALKGLWDNPSLLRNAQAILKKMPDFERELTKIHTYGNKFYATDHPDGRAIFYEAVTYSKRKIHDFLKTLKAFENAQDIASVFHDCEDHLLRKLTQFKPNGVNVDLSKNLKFFKNAFNQEVAEKEGKIIPKKGVVQEYDRVEKKISELNAELDVYLEEQSKFFGCKIHYFGTDKKRFQLDVPEHKSHKANSTYQLENAKKGAKPMNRYTTSKTRMFLSEMLKAEAEKSKVILDLNRCIFEKFSEKNDEFDQVVQCLAILDVICSLSEYARTYSQDICIPDVQPFSYEPVLIIEEGSYPCAPNVESFVPNDTKMGVDNHAPLMIITGPNMGGKSTLMRQIAVISIMAQLGSYVPAVRCQINLIDRVFTRLGAQDDIIQGQSTFFVELSEACSILRHATKDSLVIIDELGRGTSTHDGNAIATAYVKKLSTIGCRTMFSTHYHTLVDHFLDSSSVQLCHMACMVENDDDVTEESVTFLYKLAKGRCPKSYGFNAARLAGLDMDIVKSGREKAKYFEEENKLRQVFRIVFTSNNMSQIQKALASL